MKITRVAPGGVADRAGIRSGDELLAVGDRRLRGRHRPDVRARRGPTGPRRSIELSRDGAPFTVTLPPADPEELGYRGRGGADQDVRKQVRLLLRRPAAPRAAGRACTSRTRTTACRSAYGNYVTLTNLSDERLRAHRRAASEPALRVGARDGRRREARDAGERRGAADPREPATARRVPGYVSTRRRSCARA